MTNKKFKRRKPVIQTSAWQMPKKYSVQVSLVP